MVPLFPTVHTGQDEQGHSLTCQRMAKFASLCCDLLFKEKVEQTEHRCVVTYMVLLRHGQAITSVSVRLKSKKKEHFLANLSCLFVWEQEITEIIEKNCFPRFLC